MSRPGSGAAQHLARVGEALAAIGALVLIVFLPAVTRAGQWPTALAVALALAGGAASTLAELGTPRRAHDDRSTSGSDTGGVPGDAGVTTLLRVGDEPTEVLRTSVMLAAQAGPCALVAGGDCEVPEAVRSLDVPVFRAATVADATCEAARQVRTEAVLLLSGRAVPVMANCRRAAAHLDETRGWVIGGTRPFNHDRYAPECRSLVGALLRAGAQRAGLELWESNATLLSTELLRAHPFEAGRPNGSWLRARQAEGHQGVRVADTVALVAAPAGASTFWPDVFAQQRGTAADAADAMSSGSVRRRLLAMLLVLRELYAVPLLAWMVLLFVVAGTGRFPFEAGFRWSIPAVIGILALRWVSLRVALGVSPHPVADLRSALYYLPGSLAAIPSAALRRVRPPLVRISTRPLVWAALFLTLLTGASLADHDTSQPVSRLAVGTSLVALVALWLFSIRALVQRGWERTGFRTPVDLVVRIAGVPGRAVDGSPDGLAVVGTFSSLDLGRGDEVELELHLDDGRRISSTAVLAGRRPVGGAEMLGVSMQLNDMARARWAAQLLRAGLANAGMPTGVAPRKAPDDPEDDASAPVAATGPAVGDAHGMDGNGVHEAQRSGGLHPGSNPQMHEMAALMVAGATGLEDVSARARVLRAVDRIAMGLVVAISLVVVCTLGLVMFGYQPAIVRSASMVPAFGVGDVVLTEAVPVSELLPGDVVTRPGVAGGREPVTHRLVSATVDGDQVRITTKGDANPSGETWTAPVGSTLRRVRFAVPRVGIAVSGLRNNLAQVAVGVAAFALLGFAVFRRRGQPSPVSGTDGST